MKRGIDYPGISVVFFCHDGQGNVVMQLRGRNCTDEQGTWDIGGGAIHHRETILQALTREVQEEYEVIPEEVTYLGYREVFRATSHWIAFDHAILVPRERISNGEPQKFDQIQWHPIGFYPQPLHSQLPIFFQKYEQELGRLQKK